MKVIVLGLRKLDFLDENDVPVNGVQIHGHYFDPDMTGQCTKPIFIKDKSLKAIGFPLAEKDFETFIGETFDLEFNHKKQVIGIEVLEA